MEYIIFFYIVFYIMSFVLAIHKWLIDHKKITIGDLIFFILLGWLVVYFVYLIEFLCLSSKFFNIVIYKSKSEEE